MWFVHSWFDGEDGREYTVGRKEGAVDLCIPMLRVSRMAGTLQVAPMSAEQLGDPAYIPQVCWIMHARSKTGSLVETFRGKNRVEQRIRVETPIPLTDRARVRLVNDVSLELHWVPCTVGIVRVPSLEAEDVRRRACASGVHLVTVRESLDVRCTHLCVAHVRPNRTQLLALVRGIPIVTAAYIEAAIACPAERVWPESRLYVPPLDARLALDTPLSTSQLAPSSKRAMLFRGTTLVFVLPGPERRYADFEQLAVAAEGHVVVHDLRKHPLGSVRDAEHMLREAQAAADAHWAARPMPVPVQETFVLCGETTAPWTPLVTEAAQRSRIRVMPQGVAAVAECILEARTCAELYVAGQGTTEAEDDATLLLSGTQGPLSPSGAQEDQTRHDDDNDVFPPTQPAGPAAYAGDISLYSPEQRPQDETMDLTEALPLSDSPSLEDITDPTVDGVGPESERWAPHMDPGPAALPLTSPPEVRRRDAQEEPRVAPREVSPAPTHLLASEASPSSASALPCHEAPRRTSDVSMLPPATGPFQASAEARAPVSSTPPPPALQRLAGTRQARRSFLLDELFGLTPQPAATEPTPSLSGNEDAAGVGQTLPPGESTRPAPVVRSSSPPATAAAGADSRARSATPPSASMDTSLQRTSFMQVRYVPLVREAPEASPVRNYKKFRAQGPRPAPRRVALVLPHNSHGRPSPSHDALFLDEPCD
ncbi:hypothetical protein MBRA1_002672 [Malassezia brasiliensis]|uniref:BRCT domain-containing protein n=1 Tax=Malassezia brasiliensis TaxID=1821822 RepID=A0AAF0IQF6_9BASI|nr:hypothetical protein MBRA1_002672 [Malassezia brasiliensis]